jgi:hypothetical protein
MRFKVDDKPYYWSWWFQTPQQIWIRDIEGEYYIDLWGLYYTDNELYTTKEDAEWDNTDHLHF